LIITNIDRTFRSRACMHIRYVHANENAENEEKLVKHKLKDSIPSHKTQE